MVPEPGKVLLVDDSDNDRLLFKIAYEHAGVRALRLLESLASGAEAIAYLGGVEPYSDRTTFPYPDVLILDLKMPFKSGFDVLRFLRTQPSSLPVFVLSDSNAKSDRDRAIALGAKEYLVKPDGLPELVELFNRLETAWCAGALKPSPGRAVTGPPRRSRPRTR